MPTENPTPAPPARPWYLTWGLRLLLTVAVVGILVLAVRFTYRPASFVVGAWTTLLACLLSIGYLLRVDRWLRRS